MKISFNIISKLVTLIAFSLLINKEITAQKPYSVQMTESFLSWYPDSIVVKPRQTSTWDYEQGLILKAIDKVWHRTAEPKYFNYILKDLNRFVSSDGSIHTYKYEDFNLDNISTGRELLMLYQQSLQNKEKYKLAAYQLWKQLENQPKTDEGGYWHKQRYPSQMWLDGLFMAEPFSAEFAVMFNHPEHFDHIAKQFELIEKYAVDRKTGLVYHGYDDKKEQKWADKKTGLSPHFWSRAIGWYAMALVEVLDYMPENHPKRKELIQYLNRLAPALVKYQDQKSGVWYQMTTLGGKKGNYLEASGSCMFVYALAKGVRKGYLPTSFLKTAKKGYSGILKEFIEKEADGTISINNTVSVGGLGGNPYRDGSYEYYIGEPIRKNDLKGVGPFIFASIEMEMAEEDKPGIGKNVGLDYHFNREFRKGFDGNTEQFHYTWEDTQHSGFLWLGNIFENLGAKTVSIKGRPNASNLKDLDVYIIVDPDTKKETEFPNFIEKDDIKHIAQWVKNGGTLLVMANDTVNCEIPHLNELIKTFGISFTNKSRNMVLGTNFVQGQLIISSGNTVFPNTKKIFIKELVTLNLDNKNAKTVLSEGEDIIMASANYGKGKILVIGDPWLYNEYVDNRRITPDYQNFQAAKDLANWLLKK